jgi:selenocysteine-specific elongation factor
VRILPGGRECRVRAVQVHGRSVERARAGERVALNLAGVERDEIGRGHVVCDPELERVGDRMDVWVELRPAARRPLASHALVRLHVGTAEAMAKVIWLDGRPELAPRASAYAQLVSRQPIAAFGGDRFILREQTGRATIGGGVVLRPFAARPARRPDPRLPLLTELHAARDPAARLDVLLRLESAFAVSPESLAAAANLRASEVRSALSKSANVRPLPSAEQAEAYTTPEKWERLRRCVAEALAAFHAEAPKQPGMEMESLRSGLAPDLSPKVFRAVVAELEKEGVLARRDSVVHVPSHRVGLDDGERRLAEAAERLLLESGLTPPDLRAIETQLAANRSRLNAVLTQLEREGRIVRVAPDLLFAAPAVERARALVRDHAVRHGDIDAATLRDLIGASRKFSIALLNYFDRTGFTIRIGDVRKVRRSST